MSKYGEKVPAEEARRAFDLLIAKLRPKEPPHRIEISGSVLRGRPLVGDLDVVVDGTDPFWVAQVEAALVSAARDVRRTKAGVVKGGMVGIVPVELYPGKPGAFGAIKLFCTGSGEWNIYQRSVATRKGLMLSQWGLFREAVDHKGKRVAGDLVAAATEEEIFEALGMKYIEPKDREAGRFGR